MGSMRKVAFWASVPCFAFLLNAQSPAPCPTTVGQNITFPTGSYICGETDNVWYAFEDLGAVTAGDSALPDDTVFHIDTVVPGTIAITLEPAGPAQFNPGATYSWTFIVAEDDVTNQPIFGADADYGAEGVSPIFTTQVNALTNFTGYNANGTPIATLGGQVGTITNTNGANRFVTFAAVLGVQFTDTLTGIGANTTVQSISNSIEEADEPAPEWLLGLGLIFLGLLRVTPRPQAHR